MTWQRVYSSSIEMLYAGELDGSIVGGGPSGNLPQRIWEDYSKVRVHTGEYSISQDSHMVIGKYIRGNVKSARAGCYHFPGDPPFFGASVPIIYMLHINQNPSFPTHRGIVFYGGRLLRSTSNELFIQIIDTDGQIILAEIPPFSGGFEPGKWCALSMLTEVGENGFFEFYINGELVYRHDFADVTWSNNRTYVRFFQGNLYGLNDWYIDDMYVDYSETSEPHSTPPSPRFFPIPLSNDGTLNDWAKTGSRSKIEPVSRRPRYAEDYPILVSENNAEDQTFIPFSVEDVDEWGIEAIVLQARASDGDYANPNKMRFITKSSLNLSAGDAHQLDTGYRHFESRFALDPDGNPWGKQIRDYEFGVRSEHAVA